MPDPEADGPPDCLVCLQPIKRLWTPPTKCPCKPFIHERCWNSWTRHIGAQVCLICRGAPERRPVAAIMIVHEAPRRLLFYQHFFVVYTPWFTMAFIVFTLIWLQVQTRRAQLTAGRPLPMRRPYLLNTHDEL